MCESERVKEWKEWNCPTENLMWKVRNRCTWFFYVFSVSKLFAVLSCSVTPDDNWVTTRLAAAVCRSLPHFPAFQRLVSYWHQPSLINKMSEGTPRTFYSTKPVSRIHLCTNTQVAIKTFKLSFSLSNLSLLSPLNLPAMWEFFTSHDCPITKIRSQLIVVASHFYFNSLILFFILFNIFFSTLMTNLHIYEVIVWLATLNH